MKYRVDRNFSRLNQFRLEKDENLDSNQMFRTFQRAGKMFGN